MATILGQGKMSSRVATDFRIGEGPLFSIDADVLPNWTIDSVESQPTDGLDDWTLERRDPQAGAPARKLSIRLARALTSARPLRLIVSARRLYAFPGRNLGIDDLVPLRFTGLSESKRWVDLRATGSNELHLTSGDHLRRADVKDLTAAELDLFAEPPGDLLFRDDAGTAGLRLSLENRRPTYSATVRAEAVVGDAVLVENYTFACTPAKAAPIDRVVVHFAGGHHVPMVPALVGGGPLNWSVAGMDESRFSARRWTPQQQSSAGLTADEEAWDVTFRALRSAPLEIRASRKTKLIGPTPVSLASLPDAVQQDAMLVVRSLGPQNVEIKTHRLKLLPTEAAPAGQVQTVRASYQYDPRTESTPQSEPAIVLTAVGGELEGTMYPWSAWVWDCEIRSQFAANGAADHVVSYQIQNAGSRQVRLTLPAPLTLRDVHGMWVNDKPAAVGHYIPPARQQFQDESSRAGLVVVAGPSPPAPLPGTGEGSPPSNVDQLTIDLPADLKFVKLELRISTQGEPLGTVRRLRPPLLDIGLPVFARRWWLKLPPGYAACGYGQVPQAAGAASFSLRRCLLGCLGRSEEQSVFNPFRREDWQSALRGRQTEDHPADPGTVAETAGWTQFPIDLADGTSTVIVVRRAAIDAGSWLLFLAIVGIGAWGLSGRPLALLLLAVMLAIPALLLPATIAAIFSHGLLGVMFCLLLELVRRMTAAGPADSRRGALWVQRCPAP